MTTWAGPPRSYSKGRTRAIQYVVWHTTEGSEGPNSAEDGHHYDTIRTDGTSTHVFVDSDNGLREVMPADRAHHARYHGNEIGYGIEICGRAGQGSAGWADATSQATLVQLAKATAEVFRELGWSADRVRRLSVAEVRGAYYNGSGSRPFGICGHVDVTNAYPEDNGDHTDPGPTFPWAQALELTRRELEGDIGGDEMGLFRYQFADDWGTARPAALGNRVVATDRLGVWDVEPQGSTDGKNASLGAGLPGVIVVSRAGTNPGNSFADVFSIITGNAVYSDALQGVADWRKTKGDKGDPGEPGAPGEPGKDGADGADGTLVVGQAFSATVTEA